MKKSVAAVLKTRPETVYSDYHRLMNPRAIKMSSTGTRTRLSR